MVNFLLKKAKDKIILPKKTRLINHGDLQTILYLNRNKIGRKQQYKKLKDIHLKKKIKMISKKRFVYLNNKSFTNKNFTGILQRLKQLFRMHRKLELPTIHRIKDLTTSFEQTHYWKRDVFFNSFWFTKLTNKFIKRGRKHFAEKTTSYVLRSLKYKFKQDSFIIYWKLLIKIKPIATTVPKRVGKLYHHVPIPIKYQRGYKLGLQWLLNGAKSQKNFMLQSRIFNEIIATLDYSRSFTIKQRDSLYFLITENRTYSHFRWI